MLLLLYQDRHEVKGKAHDMFVSSVCIDLMSFGICHAKVKGVSDKGRLPAAAPTGVAQALIFQLSFRPPGSLLQSYPSHQQQTL